MVTVPLIRDVIISLKIPPHLFPDMYYYPQDIPLKEERAQCVDTKIKPIHVEPKEGDRTSEF